jgi:NAD(P)-dependent dehydrogenase (short-subunit alcohol dehydrogenase family)
MHGRRCFARKGCAADAKRGRGYIVNQSSIGSQRVLPDYVVVGASKAALEAVTRYLAVELAPWGIVVNAVSGGTVLTDALKHFRALQDSRLLDHGEERAGRAHGRRKTLPRRRVPLHPAAEMIRGQDLIVDAVTRWSFAERLQKGIQDALSVHSLPLAFDRVGGHLDRVGLAPGGAAP